MGAEVVLRTDVLLPAAVVTAPREGDALPREHGICRDRIRRKGGKTQRKRIGLHARQFAEQEADALDARCAIFLCVVQGNIQNALGNRHFVHLRAPPKAHARQIY